MTVAEAPSFGPELFAFLRELAANNDRTWFAENKDRYVANVQEPALAFVEDVGMRMPEISRHIVADARTTGGSLFRIYRDTRFSKDKTPYKTHCGVQFRHARTRDVHAPGFYLHLEPGSVFMACGVWHPERETLHAIRSAIAAKPARWTAVSDIPGFRLGGESLKRPPAGFDRDHPLIEELKRKDFMAISEFSEDEAVSGEFLDEFIARCARASDFMRFLCDATRVEY
ncbi:DUF2461 domain-containing protein [Solirubrobacter sp. CPCC 204708]|uniref:DUF2461 domain-containing protein n=1 Tax=Solirubrobacter deserti TaxID=2282478 RepID=A0ABT4RCX8_9ACTN|nr:DUF2461 domain-containing protein [Solirubrobacter deserti]MDA0136392.1 DUF2461 domain-containing protein [Solirubrobacter deserti]